MSIYSFVGSKSHCRIGDFPGFSLAAFNSNVAPLPLKTQPSPNLIFHNHDERLLVSSGQWAMRRGMALIPLSTAGLTNVLNKKYHMSTHLASTDGQRIEAVNPFDITRTDYHFTKENDVVKGYEYLHPDITSLLLTEASWSLNEECPFFVEPTSLIMQVNSGRHDDVQKLFSSDYMPLHQLAYLAEECESAVFGSELKDRFSKDNGVQQVSGKILGLICLSMLPSAWPNANECKNILRCKHATTNVESEGKDAATLVATMVSLNLLESSIRSVVRDADLEKNKSNSNQKNKVGAPLLRDMIESLSEIDMKNKNAKSEEGAIDFKVLASILRALLLPTRLSGINLRNLISHGFLSTVDRRWFALTIVLIQTLDSYLRSVRNHGHAESHNQDIDEFNKNQEQTITNLRKYEPMANIVSCGQKLLLSNCNDLVSHLNSAFVPLPYLHITQFIFGTLVEPLQQTLVQKAGMKSNEKSDNSESSDVAKLPSLTTIFLIAASSLLEHSLRLKWCKANNKMEESIARPSKYYVTLDGHGQRDRHDVMISPYLQDGSKNRLIPQIGAVSALLSDLFSAPSAEAPNIRSQLCHGTWDAEVIHELESLAHWILQNGHQARPSKDSAFLVDTACAITASLQMLASGLSADTSYKSVYSYSAMWTRDLDASICHLSTLKQIVSNDSIIDCINRMESKQVSVVSHELAAFGVRLDMIRQIQQSILPPSKAIQDIWADYDLNILLSECIAAQTLLTEVSDCSNRYLKFIQDGMKILSQKPTSTKEKRSQKTLARICGLASTALEFYTISVYVCLAMMQNAAKLQSAKELETSNCQLTRADYVKVVERTRMTLSTFDNYMDKNLDRSLKALSQYLSGKALRKVVSS